MKSKIVAFSFLIAAYAVAQPYDGGGHFLGASLVPGYVARPTWNRPGTTIPAGDAAPTITSQPASLSVAVGAAASFSVAATGTPNPSYQWFRNNRPIWGANGATFTVASVNPKDAGAYSVIVGNPAGFVISQTALLSVTSAAITISAAPASQSVNAGSDVTLSVAAAGTGLTYQWRFNDWNIQGATSPTLNLNAVGSTASGNFEVVISDASGVEGIEVASLDVVTNAWLSNLSVRGEVGTSNEDLIVGFVVNGTGEESVLLRAIGPTLASFGVTGFLATPELTLASPISGTIASNSSWGGTSALAAVFTQVGAFPLPADSVDAALLESLSPGPYTAVTSGASNASGVALGELYDADTAESPTAHLVNISGRAFVTSGSGVLTAGFVISGTTSETVLVRGVGPGLKPFGFSNSLKSTKVTLFDSSNNVITTNAGWGNDPAINSAGNLVGAFSLVPGSGDSALLVTLAPGAYTVQVTDAADSSGVGLAEIYEVK